MLKNSSKFFKAFDGEERSDLSVRLTINGQVYSNDDIFSLSYESSSMSGDQLEIGSSYSNSINVTFCDTITTFKELDKVVVELGIKREPLDYGIIGGEVAQVGYAEVGSAPLNGYYSAELKRKFDVRGRFARAGKMYMNRWNAQEDYEYSRMGEFYISEQIDVNWNEKTTTLECSDALIFTESPYTTQLNYPAQLRDIVKEAGRNVGLTLDYLTYDRLPDMFFEKLMGDMTNRQALETFSQFIIGYVTINRFGYLELKSLTDSPYVIDPKYYFSKGLSKNEISYRVGGITCTIEGEGDSYDIHAGGDTGVQMNIKNNLMTQELLNLIYDKLSVIDYYPYSLSWRGNPALEVGDYVMVSDLKGYTYKVPNMSYKVEFNGALKATSSADTKSITNIISSDKSPLIKNLTKTVNQVMLENATVADKLYVVNETVVDLNRSMELADLQGIRVSVSNLLEVTESVVKDVDILNHQLLDVDFDRLKEDIHLINMFLGDVPVYWNATTTTDGLFSKENVQILLNHTNYLNEIITGTGWIALYSSYANELYAPRFRKRNKRIELQFSLKGFTAEGQTAVTLPEGSRSQRLLQKYLLTTEGKPVIVTIGTDGSVKIAKVFGSGISSTDVFTLDAEFPTD